MAQTSHAKAVVVPQTLSVDGLDIEAAKDVEFSGVIATFADSLPGGAASDYAASIHWGDGITSSGTVQSDSDGAYLVRGTHTFVAEAWSPSLPLRVRINRVGGSTIDTNPTNDWSDDSATVYSATPFLATQGVPTGERLLATLRYFATCNSECVDLDDYSAAVTWDDGTSSAGTLVADGAYVPNGWNSARVLGDHTYALSAALGAHLIGITITGPSSWQQVSRTKATLLQQTLTATGRSFDAVQDISFTRVVASFTDLERGAKTSDYTATVDWGDGTTSAGTLDIDQADGSFRVKGTHTFDDEFPGDLLVRESYPIKVRVARTNGPTVLVDSSISVLSVAPIVAAPNVPTGEQTLATFDYFATCNPGCVDATDFSAIITWGDATSSAATIVEDGTYTPNAWNTAMVTGDHTNSYYASGGVFVIDIQISRDSTGLYQHSRTKAIVASDPSLIAPSRTIEAAKHVAFSGVVSTFTDVLPGIASDYEATIDWNWTGAICDPSEGVAGGGPPGGEEPPGGGGLLGGGGSGGWGNSDCTFGTVEANQDGGYWVKGSHVYDSDGWFQLQVKINRVGGSPVTSWGNAQVYSVPPVLATQSVPTGQVRLTTFEYYTSWQDCMTWDEWSASGQFHASIDWGDTWTYDGTLVAEQGCNPEDLTEITVRGEHNYSTSPGTYPILINVYGPGQIANDRPLHLSSRTKAIVIPQTLSGAARDIEATKGVSFTATVATFRDVLPGGPGDYQATIDWGDGGSSAGWIISDGLGGFKVKGSHTYLSEWPQFGEEFQIKVRLNRIDGATALSGFPGSGFGWSANHHATVYSVAPIVVTETVPIRQQTLFNFEYFAYCDPQPDPDEGCISLWHLTAAINWGDGTTDSGVLVPETAYAANAWNRVRVEGYHTYMALGTHPITVSINTTGLPSFAQPWSWLWLKPAWGRTKATVVNQTLFANGRTIEAVKDVSFSGVVAAFSDQLPGRSADYRAKINWGDGTITDGTIEPDGEGGYRVRGSHTYQSEWCTGWPCYASDFPISVRINRVNGATVDTNGFATVYSVPTIQGTEGVPIGQRTLWTFEYFAYCNAPPESYDCLQLSDFEGTINWGNATASTGALVPEGNYVQWDWNRVRVEADHTYASPVHSPFP